MQNINEADKLERLVKLTQDSINGYRKAAELVRDGNLGLAQLFEERLSKRHDILQQLKMHLRVIDPENDALVDTDGTVSGAIHQSFMSFRSLFQDDRNAALAEIDRGESRLLEAFEEELEEVGMELEQVLQSCIIRIREDQRVMESLHEAV